MSRLPRICGAERRRLFLVGTLVSLAAPLLPYLTGAWETAWFALAALPLPLPIRALVFLLGFHLALAVIMAPLGYYGGYVLPRAFGLGRQSRRAWAVDWLKVTAAEHGPGIGRGRRVPVDGRRRWLELVVDVSGCSPRSRAWPWSS